MSFKLNLPPVPQPEIPKGKRRIHQNVWGNWNGYVGRNRVIEFGTDWRRAEEWVNDCQTDRS
jgi:hypothetical protein